MSTAAAPADAPKKPFSDFNKVEIKGNLVRDPEARYLPSGTLVLNGTIACHNGYERQGEKREETHYFRFAVFSKAAEAFLSSQPAKGQKVRIEGRLSQRRWTTPEGQKRDLIEIVAYKIELAPGGKPADSSAPAAGMEPGMDPDAGEYEYQESL